MKARILTYQLPACSGALMLGLLLGALNASALQTAPPSLKSGSITAAPVTARHGQTTLTPAAPVSSQVPASSEEDIRDIRQPRHLPSPLPWAAAAAGVIMLAATAFALWKWIRRGKFLQMLPHEVALQYLEEARRLMDPDHAREYCFAVSKIIRGYIEERFQVHAPTLTTEEFLRDMVGVRATMLEPHRALLGEFLQHCDLAKFAGWRYSRPDLEAMHASARSFVQLTAVVAATPGGEGTLPAVVKPANRFSGRRSRTRKVANLAVPGDSPIAADGERRRTVSCDSPV